MISPQPGRAISETDQRSKLIDLVVMGVGLALFYGILSIARTWFSPVSPEANISLSPAALPIYAGYSLLRIAVAYMCSLTFAVDYGYIAAYNEKAERIMVPALDILQSIPVLSFLPGVMLAMAALFPRQQLGLELGSILLIFTGQAWNIAFSFYSALKSIPRDLKEAALINRFSGWQRFVQLELPYSAIGLVWNSMMSVAGGWFFLMVCEMFQVGQLQVRLPGLGSYLQTAANAGNTGAILWGLGAMITVIVLLDQMVWRPVTVWTRKFKFEEVESASVVESGILNLLRRSAALEYCQSAPLAPAPERVQRFFLLPGDLIGRSNKPGPAIKWLERVLAVVVLAAAGYGVVRAGQMVASLSGPELHQIADGTLATFLRVTGALVIGAAWSIPVGVWIGFNPRLARLAQPLAQIAASIPATGLFPIVLLILINAGLIGPEGKLGIASLLLMLLGTQWYILFNVIAGAMAIPTDLKEASRVFRFDRFDRWRLLIL